LERCDTTKVSTPRRLHLLLRGELEPRRLALVPLRG